MSKIQKFSINHKRGSRINCRPLIKGNKVNPRRRAPEPHGIITAGGELLPFNSRGKLPYGIHAMRWEEFTKQFAFNSTRKRLLRGLVRAIFLLRRAGCRTIYVGGSYVTTKRKPFDIDCVWESRGMDWEHVKRVAPVFLKAKTGHDEQMARFGGEFFPSQCGEKNTGLTWLDFFQRDKQPGRRRGIVRIDIAF